MVGGGAEDPEGEGVGREGKIIGGKGREGEGGEERSKSVSREEQTEVLEEECCWRELREGGKMIMRTMVMIMSTLLTIMNDDDGKI